MREARLTGADAVRRQPVWANLHTADLRATDLSEANVQGAGFTMANLNEASTANWNTNIFTAFYGVTWPTGRKCGFPSLGACD